MYIIGTSYHLTVDACLDTTGWCVMLTPSLGVAPRQRKPPLGRDVEGHDVEGDLVGSPSPSHPPFSPSPAPVRDAFDELEASVYSCHGS